MLEQKPIRQEEDKNKSHLQAVLTVSVTDIKPTTISCGSPTPLSVTISVQQTHSVHPDRPLTISTWRTPFNVANESLTYAASPSSSSTLEHDVRIEHRPSSILNGSSTNKEKVKSPLTRGSFPRSPAYRIHWAQPEERDYRQQMNFITIPSLASGLAHKITGDVNIPEIIMERRGKEAGEGTRQGGQEGPKSDLPAPGDLYQVQLASECHIEWWNWGDVRRAGERTSDLPNDLDLSNKKFVNLPHPSISGRSDSENRLGDDWVIGYGWDLDEEDEEGNEMVYLDVDVEGIGKDGRGNRGVWELSFTE